MKKLKETFKKENVFLLTDKKEVNSERKD